MKHLDLFSGIGGFAYAVDQVWENAEHTFVENDAFCQKVLKKHWPNSEIYGDIRQFITDTRCEYAYHKENKQKLESERSSEQSFKQPRDMGRVDLLTGGFPCQPFSQAGRRKGTADNRYLWPEMFRVIQLTKPTWVIAENVRGLVTWNEGMVLEQVCADLESEGYEVQPFINPAVAVNAPHRRDRVWIVANRAKLYEERSERQRGSRRQPEEAFGNRDSNAQNPISKRSGGRMESNGQILERQSTEVKNERPSWEENWLEVATELCGVFNGLSRELDEDMNDVIYSKYAKIFNKITRQDLPHLWKSFQSEEFQRTIGRFNTLQHKDYLFTVLWQYSFRTKEQDYLPFESKEVQDAYLRNVWNKKETGCSSSGWEYNEQHAEEHKDTLSQLSYEITLATEEIWKRYLKDRNQRLKSLGNAIVPAVAVEIMKSLAEQSIKSLLDKDK